jgi:hypothetical protein
MRVASGFGIERIAYALSAELFASTLVAPKTLEDFLALKREAIMAARDTTDAYVENHVRWHVGWEEAHRGRTASCKALPLQLGYNISETRLPQMWCHWIPALFATCSQGGPLLAEARAIPDLRSSRKLPTFLKSNQSSY